MVLLHSESLELDRFENNTIDLALIVLRLGLINEDK